MESLSETLISVFSSADGFFIRYDEEQQQWEDVSVPQLIEYNAFNCITLKSFVSFNEYGDGGVFVSFKLEGGWSWNRGTSAYQINKAGLGPQYTRPDIPLTVQVLFREGERVDEKRWM